MPIVLPNEISPRTCRFFCSPKNGKLCRPLSCHSSYINILCIQIIYPAGLNQCLTFRDQKLLRRQRTIVSPKYIFHGLDRGTLVTVVQGLQLNLSLLSNLGGYIKRKIAFPRCLQGFAIQYGVLIANFERMRLKNGSK